jgi:hypothetical protein
MGVCEDILTQQEEPEKAIISFSQKWGQNILVLRR